MMLPLPKSQPWRPPGRGSSQELVNEKQGEMGAGSHDGESEQDPQSVSGPLLRPWFLLGAVGLGQRPGIVRENNRSCREKQPPPPR